MAVQKHLRAFKRGPFQRRTLRTSVGENDGAVHVDGFETTEILEQDEAVALAVDMQVFHVG